MENRQAPIDEIEHAISQLTEVQRNRLRQFSQYRHQSLGSRRTGRDPDDLLSDAIVAVLEGRRKWNRGKVDFFNFLVGVIRSLCSHIRDGRPTDAFDEIDSSESAAKSLRSDGPGTASTVQDDLEARALDEEIRRRFKDDACVTLIYESLLQGMSPKEIQGCLEISTKKYDASVKRLRRAVSKMRRGGHT